MDHSPFFRFLRFLLKKRKRPARAKIFLRGKGRKNSFFVFLKYRAVLLSGGRTATRMALCEKNGLKPVLVPAEKKAAKAVKDDGSGKELRERVMLEYHRFKTVSDLFLKGRHEEARLELAELQRRYVALCDENITLKTQIQEYEDILYLARNLSKDGGFYWLKTGSIKQGPFCPICYDRDGLLMRLSGDAGTRFCVACRESFAAPVPVLELAAPGAERVNEKPHCAPVREKPKRTAKVIPFSK